MELSEDDGHAKVSRYISIENEIQMEDCIVKVFLPIL